MSIQARRACDFRGGLSEQRPGVSGPEASVCTREIYDSMCAELAKLANAAVLGDGCRKAVTHGPAAKQATVREGEQILADAKPAREVIAEGGVGSPRLFVMPTIVRVSPKARGSWMRSNSAHPAHHSVLRSRDALARAISLRRRGWVALSGHRSKRAQELADRMEAGRLDQRHTGMSPGVPSAGAKQSGSARNSAKRAGRVHATSRHFYQRNERNGLSCV